MSRIGKQPVPIPEGVEASASDGSLHVKGPIGELDLQVHRDLAVKVDDGMIVVERPTDTTRHKSLHGLTRSLVANMVEGVTEGFSKTLEIKGVGYRADQKGRGITLNLGFSHPVEYEPPEGITLETPDQTTIVVKGADKQMVGQVAAEIRQFRPPEPYKGKGIRYRGEQIRRKAGKTATAGVMAG